MANAFAYDLDNINADNMMPEDLADFATHLQVLLDFAHNKRAAMLMRVAGQINDALYFEKRCDDLHKRLPSNWQW